MAPRTQYDVDSFRDLVKNGKTKAEIMVEMSIKNTATFNSLLLRLMKTDKKYYAVKDSKKTDTKKVQKTAIGKNNTLTLSSKMLEDTGFQPGDSFVVNNTKNKIILTLVEDWDKILLDYQSELEGMIADNRLRELNGFTPAYGDKQFRELIEKYHNAITDMGD